MTEKKTFMGFPIETASAFEIEQAKKYGERITGQDGDLEIVAYQWRGKVYLVEENTRPS